MLGPDDLRQRLQELLPLGEVRAGRPHLLELVDHQNPAGAVARAEDEVLEQVGRPRRGSPVPAGRPGPARAPGAGPVASPAGSTCRSPAAHRRRATRAGRPAGARTCRSRRPPRRRAAGRTPAARAARRRGARGRRTTARPPTCTRPAPSTGRCRGRDAVGPGWSAAACSPSASESLASVNADRIRVARTASCSTRSWVRRLARASACSCTRPGRPPEVRKRSDTASGSTRSRSSAVRYRSSTSRTPAHVQRRQGQVDGTVDLQVLGAVQEHEQAPTHLLRCGRAAHPIGLHDGEGRGLGGRPGRRRFLQVLHDVAPSGDELGELGRQTACARCGRSSEHHGAGGAALDLPPAPLEHGQLPPTTDERPGRRAQLARQEVGRCREQQRRVVREHLAVQAPQLLTGLDAEVVAQDVTGAGVGGQRVGLTLGAVQGQDQQVPQPLPQGVRVHEGLQLGDHVASQTLLDVGGDPILEHRLAQLLEPPRLTRAHPVPCRAGVRGAPPQGQRLGEQCGPRRRASLGHRLSPQRREPDEATGVDRVVRHRQAVPGSLGQQEAGPAAPSRLEDVPQPQHVVLQRLRRRPRGVVTPEVVDQLDRRAPSGRARRAGAPAGRAPSPRRSRSGRGLPRPAAARGRRSPLPQGRTTCHRTT